MSDIPLAPEVRQVPDPEVVETGHPGVDAALARLGELGDVPPQEHAAVFDGVHEQLRQVLAALDQPHP